LVGKLFEASIGEPWDFQSSAGQNKIKGNITSISKGPDSDWLLLDITPFKHDGIEINQVVAVNRYKSSQDMFGQLLSGESITVNFMYPADGHKLSPDTLWSELEDETKFRFLVGSIYKIGDMR